VDDRLLHGQVALGWRHRLDPASFWIADDSVAADPFTQEILRGSLPDGTTLEVRSIEGFLEARGAAPAIEKAVLLVRGLQELDRLVRGGFSPEEVNLGGIHQRPGARRVLDYIFLTDEDTRVLRDLHGRGIRFFAQDVPGAKRVEADSLLALEHGA
jgi:mannose/fructose/N-acetylgalactosamine-specific phosphotransferase system component IIB